MFDRETRREKILENMAKEARIRRSATVAEHGMISHPDLKQVLAYVALHLDELCHAQQPLDRLSSVWQSARLPS